MHMKTFCGPREHPRRRPLLWPKTNLPQNSLVTPHKFTEKSAVTLRKDCARKNLHAWNPNAFHFRFGSVCSGKLACIDTRARDPLGERASLIIARRECISRCITRAHPQIRFALVHVEFLKPLTCLTRNRPVREKDLDCNKDRGAKRQPNDRAGSSRYPHRSYHAAFHANKVLQTEYKQSDKPRVAA